MMSRKLSAGDIIEGRCTRCRKVLNHTIVAMIGERVVRVECNTCKGIHNHHPVGEAKAPAAVASGGKKETLPRKSKKDPGAADREEWESLRPDMNKERAVPYTMTARYRVNSLVDHASFGLGIVKRLIAPNKMEVLFEAGKKLLRCSDRQQ